MNYHLFHNVTGIAIIISLLLKVIFHFYIEHLEGKTANVISIMMMPMQYLRPYTFPVGTDHIKWKYICNFFFVLACLSLILNLILGILILK